MVFLLYLFRVVSLSLMTVSPGHFDIRNFSLDFSLAFILSFHIAPTFVSPDWFSSQLLPPWLLSMFVLLTLLPIQQSEVYVFICKP